MRRLAAALLVLVASCSADEPTEVATEPPTPRPAEGTEGEAVEHDRPPPVVVRADDVELELQPYTWCYRATCADGPPPDDPPSVGVADEIEVLFELEGWDLEATLLDGTRECGRQEAAPVERTSPTTHVVRPAGPAGDHVVTLALFGAGDLFVNLRWTTTEQGPYTPPSAFATVVADHDGEMDSYGVEVHAAHLATTPADASGSVVVTAAGGSSTTIELVREPIRCDDGLVRFTAPLERGKAAAALGDPPFTYDVTVVLDGVAHRATARWPDEQEEACAPCVPLELDPPLPAKSG